MKVEYSGEAFRRERREPWGGSNTLEGHKRVKPIIYKRGKP